MKLFLRSTQQVNLTDAGEAFYQGISKMLKEYDELLASISLRSRGYESEVRIGIPHYSLSYYLGQMPAMFAQRFPYIKLEFVVDHPDTLIEKLKNTELDIIIAAHMHFKYADSFSFHDVFQEQLGVLLPPSHRLADRESVDLKELSDETFLGTETNYFDCSWKNTLDMCRKNGFEPKKIIKYNQLESVFIAISLGLGVFIEGRTLQHSPKELDLLCFKTANVQER